MTTCNGLDGSRETLDKESYRIRAKVILNEAQAREIFQHKNQGIFPSRNACSKYLAMKHGVSCKAIRDIWNGRSWLDATYYLWNEEDRPRRRAIGRPKGSKDRKPRSKKSKQIHDDTSNSVVLEEASNNETMIELLKTLDHKQGSMTNSYDEKPDLPKILHEHSCLHLSSYTEVENSMCQASLQIPVYNNRSIPFAPKRNFVYLPTPHFHPLHERSWPPACWPSQSLPRLSLASPTMHPFRPIDPQILLPYLASRGIGNAAMVDAVNAYAALGRSIGRLM